MKRNLGLYFIAALVALNVLLWIFFGPTTGHSTDFPLQKVAETFSSSAVILIACTLVLVNKNINILALLLLLIHLIIVPNSGKQGPGLWLGWITYPTMLLLVLITIAPRVPLISRFLRLAYHQWKKVHKYMGVLFLMGVTRSE